MNRMILLAVGLLGMPVTALAEEDPQVLASRTRAIFSAKCAGCHGPKVPKPKGRFGYVLDLARMAANREMVVPSAPEESELWELVRRGEMPPADSPTGPLSQKQKTAIHDWIAAGALPPANSSSKEDEGDEVVSAQPISTEKSSLGWLGPFHLIANHFPIALLVAAAVGELWSAYRRNRVPSPAIRFCVILGAAGAAVAASLGWIYAWTGHGISSPRILSFHRWIGTAAAVWAIGTAVLSERDERRGARSIWFRAWLFVGAILVGVSAHFGAVLVHGEDVLG